jgi:peptide/nickel transport system substrate-binding protein
MKRLFHVLAWTVFFILVTVWWTGPAKAEPAKGQSGKSAAALKSAGPVPVKGGVLRCVRGTFPKVLGYQPEMGANDNQFAFPYAESLIAWDENGGNSPRLAESWKVDVANKTITWHLRKGVRFHDGTPFNAEAVKWNYQIRLDANSLTDGKYVKSIDVIDEYTLKMTLTEYFSSSLVSYGWAQMFSPTAFQKNGGKEWARLHPVCTGPFKLASFKRESFIRYERNEDYWRKGYPLLDAIEIRFVPDTTTAAMLMQTKEADMWLDVSDVKSLIDLESKGLKINWGPGMFWALLPNSSDQKSPLAVKKVREAIEYAIDRPTLAKTIGRGKFEPVHQLVPSISPLFVGGYNPRPFDVVKAKQLLTEAGYASGFETKLLYLETQRDAATAIQAYLGAVGIRVNLDPSDLGRYFTSIFVQGWSGLALAQSGINPDGSDLLVHFGPRPMTYKTGHIAKTPEFLDLCEKGLHSYDTAAYRNVLKKAVKQGTEDAIVIPLYRSAQSGVMQQYVHSGYPKIHITTWNVWQDWIEKKR